MRKCASFHGSNDSAALHRTEKHFLEMYFDNSVRPNYCKIRCHDDNHLAEVGYYGSSELAYNYDCTLEKNPARV